MVRYRRNFLAGGTYFITVMLADRRSSVLIDHVEALRVAMQGTRRARAFVIDAVVVLPGHLHLVMTLPPGDADYSNRVAMFKRRFTTAVKNAGVPLARHRNNEAALWQRRFWEHTIRDEMDFERYVDYIHLNPVRHNLVSRVRDWPHSSFHRYVRLGLLPEDWAGDFNEHHDNFGERKG